MIRIRLRNRAGSFIAHALIDDVDAALAEQAGWYLQKGYVVRKEWAPPDRWPAYWLHREVLGLLPDDSRRVDHIDRDPLNCCRSNLRIATHAQNMQNVPPRAGTSQHRGVYWHNAYGAWVAVVQIDKVRHRVGVFEDEDEAGAAASAFRAAHMPFAVEA